MASAPTSSARGSAQEQTKDSGGSILPLVAYFGIMLLLLLAFIVIGFIAVTAPMTPRIAFIP